MKNKKIVHILDHSVPYRDGYATRAQQIIINQKGLGFNPVVVTSDRHEPAIVYETEEIDDVLYYRSSKKIKNMKYLPVYRDIRTVIDLSRVLDRVVLQEKPDILHAHSPLLTGYAALKISRKYNIPIVYEVRALWEDAAVDQGKMKEDSMKYKLIRFLETQLAQRVDRVVVISEHLKNEFVERKIKKKKIYVVPNGVNVEKFSVSQKKDQYLLEKYNLSGKIVLGFIGSFYHFEGLEFLVQAFSEIKKGNFVLMLVGSGEKFTAVQHLVQRLGLNNSVILPGRVDHDEVAKYYSVMDIMIYPRLSKRITELVTPLKPLEAMAMGKSILASDVGGHKELIGDAGFFFKKENAEDLLGKIKKIAGNMDDCHSYSIKARKYVCAEKTWKKSIELYDLIYQF